MESHNWNMPRYHLDTSTESTLSYNSVSGLSAPASSVMGPPALPNTHASSTLWSSANGTPYYSSGVEGPNTYGTPSGIRASHSASPESGPGLANSSGGSNHHNQNNNNNQREAHLEEYASNLSFNPSNRHRTTLGPVNAAGLGLHGHTHAQQPDASQPPLPSPHAAATSSSSLTLQTDIGPATQPPGAAPGLTHSLSHATSEGSSEALLSGATSRDYDAHAHRLSGVGVGGGGNSGGVGPGLGPSTPTQLNAPETPSLTSITTAPFYAAPGQALIINAQGAPQRASLSASFSGTFFLSDAESVICYRRNMFQVKAALIAPALDACKYYVRDDSTGYAHLISNYKVQLLPTNYADGSKIDLVSKPNHAVLTDDELSILTKGENCGSVGEERLDFRRLLFRYATQNNGRRLELRQYYQLLLVVYAQTVSGLEVPVLAAFTRPIAVRGRNPAFYSLGGSSTARQRRRRKQMAAKGSTHVRTQSGASDQLHLDDMDEDAAENESDDSHGLYGVMTSPTTPGFSPLRTTHDGVNPAGYVTPANTVHNGQQASYNTNQSFMALQPPPPGRRFSLLEQQQYRNPARDYMTQSTATVQQRALDAQAETTTLAQQEETGEQQTGQTQPPQPSSLGSHMHSHSQSSTSSATQQEQPQQQTEPPQLQPSQQLSGQTEGLYAFNHSILNAPLLPSPNTFPSPDDCKAQLSPLRYTANPGESVELAQ